MALVLLVLGAAARAQPAPSRALRQRSLTVSGNPAGPGPEVRGAKGIGIAFHFDAAIREESVTVDESRIRVLAVGRQSLLVEPITEPRADQPSEVSVTFADGEQERAAFRIVPHPSEVDTWIEVPRPTEQLGAACQARVDELRARCGAQSPTVFRRSGLLKSGGVLTRAFGSDAGSGGALASRSGVSFRGVGWVLLEVEIGNASGQPWAPRVATLKSKDGAPVRVRLMTPEAAEIPPGAWRRVWVETDDPPASAGVSFILEVGGADGRSVRVVDVDLAPRTQEGKR